MTTSIIFFPRRPPLLLFILFLCFALAAWLGTVLCLTAFDFFLLAFVPVGGACPAAGACMAPRAPPPGAGSGPLADPDKRKRFALWP